MKFITSIAIASDHGGLELKNKLVAHLRNANHAVKDFGTNSEASVDYPDFAAAVGVEVITGASEFGILICGTGIGMSIAANKIPGIRAGLAHDVTTARLTRDHNDANILCLGARVLGQEVALDIADAFLATPFSNGPRHMARIAKLAVLEATFSSQNL